MALREEFERSGNWLFRWRSYQPLVLILPVVLGLPGIAGRRDAPSLGGELLCLAVSLFGLAIRVFTIGHTPVSTSGRNTREGQVAEVLNSTGMYSVVRHPLYVGNYFMWLGAAMFPGAWWPPVFVTLAFWLYYERIMFAEEEFLRRKFGAIYETWAEGTPAFIPRLGGWRPPSLPFSARTVLRREYSGLFGVVATFAVLELVENWALTGRPTMHPVWIAITVLAAVVYVTLRTLKRRTRVLKVEGR